MNNPITGLVHVTGEPDTGKTTFALECGFAPEEICFFDDDLKTAALAEELKSAGRPFGAYYNLTKLSLGMRETQYHDMVMSLVEVLPAGKFKALIFDTWTRFESTFHPIVVKNPARFREFYSPMGTIKGAEQWKASFDYEAVVLDKLAAVAPLVIVITHLKDQSIGAVKTGAQIPDVKKPIIEKSRMRLWLRHNPDGAAPIGLVLKRLSKVTLNGGGIKPVNVLPRKLKPCTWENILSYWEQPLGERAPNDAETPNAFEFSILDGALTEDQKDALHIQRLEAGKPQEAPQAISAPEPEPVKATLNDLVNAFGADLVMAANSGMIPATDEDVRRIAEALQWKPA